jgi:hypothetical protein
MAATETVMHGLRDPYAYLLQELNDRDSGRRPPWAPGQRQQLLDDLLLVEALEVAHGRRHLSFVVDNHEDPVALDLMDQIVEALTEALAAADDVRITSTDRRVTVTVGGPRASEWIGHAEQIIDRQRPPGWRMLETPRV